MDSPWDLYDELIEGVPEGIGVLNLGHGENWCMVDAECGLGIAHRLTGGRQETTCDNLGNLELKDLAALSKSWNFEEASFGVAALNAWYSQLSRLQAMGAAISEGRSGQGTTANPFRELMEQVAGRNVTVIGHFPNVKDLAPISNLTVLERNCNSPMDTPDSACEYLLPSQDYVLMTGTTLINKTLPRLLTLSQDAVSVIVGPSTVPCPTLLDRGCDILGGSVVIDPQPARLAIEDGTKVQWRDGIRKFFVRR